MVNNHCQYYSERIKFKVALLAHKAMMRGMPSYIASTLSPHSHVRSLRSESSNFLNIPIPRNKFEAKSFKFSAPRTWNGLPPQLRASDSFRLFKANLKTHLFPQQRRTKRPWRLRLWRSINKYIIIIIILFTLRILLCHKAFDNRTYNIWFIVLCIKIVPLTMETVEIWNATISKFGENPLELVIAVKVLS